MIKQKTVLLLSSLDNMKNAKKNIDEMGVDNFGKEIELGQRKL